MLLAGAGQEQAEHDFGAVGRPCGLAGGVTAADVKVYLVKAGAVRVDDEQLLLVVAEQDPFPVGGPASRVFGEAGCRDLAQAGAVSVYDEQGAGLAVGVGDPEEHDPAAVGRVVAGNVMVVRLQSEKIEELVNLYPQNPPKRILFRLTWIRL